MDLRSAVLIAFLLGVLGLLSTAIFKYRRINRRSSGALARLDVDEATQQLSLNFDSCGVEEQTTNPRERVTL